MFRLSADKLEPGPSAPHTAPDEGAVVVFEGRVRSRNEGRDVAFLEYEAAEAVARAEFENIEEEARKRFGILAVECVHRVARVEPGELAVRVTVTARHRAEAFDACRYVVDELKARVPIWKKEHYADGTSHWMNAP